jgi:hypothetical protein
MPEARSPVASEREAFLIAYAVAFGAAVSALVGYVVAPAAGIALFAASGAVGFAWELKRARAEKPAPVREAEQAGHRRRGSERRVLVIAGEALGDEELWKRLFAERDRPPAVEVLAPVLQSRTHFVTTDIDKETADARRRLEQTVASARRHGLDAAGRVGDPIDPFAALVDELSHYDVDEVIVATHRPERANWVESDMLERLHEELDVPLTQVVIDRAPAPDPLVR